MLEERIGKVLEEKLERLVRQKGAVGWDSTFQPRIRNNKIVKGTKVIRIYVEKKKPPKELRMFEVLPTELDGIEIDVVEVGYPKIPLPVTPEDAGRRRRKKLSIDPTGVVRPIVAGVSVGNIDITAGTLATFFYESGSTEVLASSNGHVFTHDCLRPPEYQRKEILQPGPYHQNNPANLAIYLKWYNQLEPEKASTCPVMNTLASGINVVSRVFRRKSRMQVIVDTSQNDIDFAVGVPVVSYDYKVLEYPIEGKKLVGLIFAGSDTISIFCKISNIMKRGYTPVIEEPVDAGVGDEVEGWSWRLDGYHGSFTVSSTSANFLVDYGSGKVLMRDVAWGGKMALPGTSGTPLYLKGGKYV